MQKAQWSIEGRENFSSNLGGCSSILISSDQAEGGKRTEGRDLDESESSSLTVWRKQRAEQ